MLLSIAWAKLAWSTSETQQMKSPQATAFTTLTPSIPRLLIRAGVLAAFLPAPRETP